MPPKEAKLPSPKTKVFHKPSPKIGKILSGTNLFILAKNKNTILTKTRGIMSKLVFKEVLKSSLLTVQIASMNKARMNTIFVIGK